MKHYFVVSLFLNGLLGGGITADDQAITYHTGKLTVSPAYRHLEMRYEDISCLVSGTFLFLPTVTVVMTSGKEYRFLVFTRKKFLKVLAEHGVMA